MALLTLSHRLKAELSAAAATITPPPAPACSASFLSPSTKHPAIHNCPVWTSLSRITPLNDAVCLEWLLGQSKTEFKGCWELLFVSHRGHADGGQGDWLNGNQGRHVNELSSTYLSCLPEKKPSRTKMHWLSWGMQIRFMQGCTSRKRSSFQLSRKNLGEIYQEGL